MKKPNLYDVGCAGKITSFNETEDGRYLIVLNGICRFRIISEEKNEKMRLAEEKRKEQRRRNKEIKSKHSIFESKKSSKYFEKIRPTFSNSIHSVSVIEAVNKSLKNNGKWIRL